MRTMDCERFWMTSRALALGLLYSVLAACNGSTESSLSLGEEKPAANEAAITGRMIEAIKAVTEQRHPDGNRLRFNQAKGLGCFDATFTVSGNLPPEFSHGVFASERSYPARLRYANATKFDDSEKDFRGLSIKLFNVPGEPLWGAPGQQDFLLNSHPALFAADPEDFLAFIEAQRNGKLWRYFIRPDHFYSLKVALRGRKQIENPFAIRYWSTTPYRLGPDRSQAVKYSVAPCTSSRFQSPADKHKNFLTDVMADQLKTAPVCLDFMVQVQKDPDTMPIENAAVTWDESESPFISVARIIIEDQPFNTAENQSACEEMTFNPWQSLAAHQPLGGINRVRRPVYSEIAVFRKAK